ncbi:NmrA/HSCARG family protein [Thaumasiovibrio sp. DFM-14]|uniref:NmrA/HSCARG family protein n=1 Tax=Thaumasiovibrio sp. DFM-14 TaxID=3384792 RepID=UPI0039A0A62D
MENKLIVVVGATGNQGQSVIGKLIKQGYRVRALVRNPKSAKTTFDQSVEIFKGDLSDKSSLKLLLNNAHGLFFALPFTRSSIEYGKVLLDLAKESNVKHIVYSSVGGADRYTEVEHYKDKKQIENYLKRINKPYTILRPVGYMETFANPKTIKVMTGMLSLYLKGDDRFQLISVQDIGKFVSLSFSYPDKYLGKEMEIAGDELSLNEIFDKIDKIKNVKVSPMRFPKFTKYILPKVMKQMFTFYANDGWCADINSLREENSELLSFEDWLKTINSY